MEATETSPLVPGPCLDSAHMRTLETTHAAPNLGAGTSEKIVPEGLKKLGRLAVWAVSGSQFIDLIWSDDDEPAARMTRAHPLAGSG